MGKKISSWTPPPEDTIVETQPQKSTSAWQPPAEDQVVEVKKKDVSAPGGNESPQPTEQHTKSTGNYIPSLNPNDPLGIGEVIGKAVYSVFAHQIPSTIASFPALNTQTYEQNLLAKEPSSYKSGIAGKLFRQNLFNLEIGKAFTVGDKEIEKEFIKDLKSRIGEEQFNKDKALYEKNMIKQAMEARSKSDEFNKQRQEWLGDVPQSYQDVSTAQGAAKYIAYQLGQSIPTMAASVVLPAVGSYAMEATDSYNESVDEIARTNNMTAQQVIEKGLDKPAKEIAGTVGVINAVLDIGGMGSVISGVRKIFTKEIGKAVAKRGLTSKLVNAMKDPLVAEPFTEALQEFNTVVGSKIAAGKSEKEAIAEAMEDYPRYIDAAIGGLAAVGGAKSVAHGMSSSKVQSAKSTVTQSDDTAGTERVADEIQSAPQWQPPSTDQVVNPQAQLTPQENNNQVVQAQQTEQQPSKTAPNQKQESATGEVTQPKAPEKPKIEPHEIVARAYHEEVKNPTHIDEKERVIAQNIGKLDVSSIANIGDRKKFGKSMALAYFAPKGSNAQSVDQAAQEMSFILNPDGDGNEITPEDIWAFMERFPKGPKTVFTPSGNPKLADLANQYSELTGKAINVKTAKSIHDRTHQSFTDERFESRSKLFDENDNFDEQKAISEYEADPEKFKSDYGFTDDEIESLKHYYYGKDTDRESGYGSESSGGIGQNDRPGQSDEGQKSQGGPLSAEFGDPTKNAQEVVAEITSKPLTHVPGLNMGSGLSAGTYVSTEEKGNRYGQNPQPAKVSIKSPFVFKSESGIIPFRNAVLNKNWNKFTEQELDADIFAKSEFTLEDLTPAGIERLAGMVRDHLIAEGYDSIYLPETESQEGELIVFDRKNVQIGDEQAPKQAQNQSEASTTTSPTNQARAPGEGGAEPPPSPPNPFEIQEPQGPFEKGTRQTIEALREESNLEQELKDGIQDFENYDKHKQDKVRDWAKKTIDSLGEAAAMAEAISWKWGRPIEQKIALLTELASRFAKRFKSTGESPAFKKAQNEAYNNYMAVMDELSKTITDTAQALAYLGMAGQMFETKEGAVRFAKKQIEDSREQALKQYEALKTDARSLLDEIDKLTKEELMKSKRVKEMIDEAKKSRVVFSKEKKKEISDFFDSLKVNTKNNGFTTSQIIPVGVLPHVWNAAVEVIKETVLATADVANAIQAGVDYIKKHHHGDFDAQKLADDLTPMVTNLMPKTEGEKEIEQKKQKLVDKYLPKDKPKTRAKRKEFFDKVIELSNAGAVSDKQLDNALAQIFGLPSMTPEIAAKIDELVENINKAPEGRFKNIEITKLTDYIAQQQKFNVSNYIVASYKAGIFSGIDTQALNIQGNAFNLVELGFTMGFFNPKTAARFYGAIGNMNNLSRSASEALNVLRTGFDPRDTGGNRRVLEQRERSFWGLGKGLKGAWQLLDPSLEQQKKYVFRALGAGDILFSNLINDAIQTEFFYREAKRQGLTGKDADKAVREAMGYTPEAIKAAGEKAKQEAAQGQIPNDAPSVTLRTYEIIEQARNPEVVARARQYASQQIMTNTPTGTIGKVARSLNQLLNEVPVLNFVIPVVNFAANAMSRAVQYMPITAAIREVAHDATKMAGGRSLGNIYSEKWSSLKNGDFDTELRLRRAVIGMASMAVLMSMLNDDEDDKNLLSELLGKKVKIHGFGPGTQFNRQKNYQLQESGWIPYSIQIGDRFVSYRNYPALNVILATMGEYNDAVRYGKLSRKEAGERLSFAIVNSFKVISEMGFLTSINTVTAAILEGDAKSVESVLTRTAQGELVPKFQKNIVNLFDPKVYSAHDIQTMTTRGLPVINSFANVPLVNALGEPIEKDWVDRIALWKKDSYSKYGPIWDANTDHKYFIPVPSRYDLEKKFGRLLTDSEFNQYFKLRGEQIVSAWSPELAKLSDAEYARKMDLETRFADYKALVAMGVMESDIMTEIRHATQDLRDVQRDFQRIRKEIKP